jgi:beta-lactam-binding protein with PASTA domain
MNPRTLKSKQRGISFFGLIMIAAVLGFSGIMIAQAVPTYIEYQAIRKAAHKAANEGSTPADVRRIYGSATAIDDIKSITPNDLEITKQGDKVVVSFAYNKEIPIGGPAYLLLKYSATTAK